MKTAVSGKRNATFGQMIQTLRRALDLTPTELAGQLGVSRQKESRWALGRQDRVGQSHLCLGSGFRSLCPEL